MHPHIDQRRSHVGTVGRALDECRGLVIAELQAGVFARGSSMVVGTVSPSALRRRSMRSGRVVQRRGRSIRRAIGQVQHTRIDNARSQGERPRQQRQPDEAPHSMCGVSKGVHGLKRARIQRITGCSDNFAPSQLLNIRETTNSNVGAVGAMRAVATGRALPRDAGKQQTVAPGPARQGHRRREREAVNAKVEQPGRVAPAFTAPAGSRSR
jgi:hypothetical protein